MRIAAIAGAVAATLAPGNARAQDLLPPECAAMVPRAAAVPVGAQIDVHVLVLLDGVTRERGAQVLGEADAPYAAIGLRLVPRFQDVSFKGADDQELLRQARETVGGRRPPSAHVVYLLTSKDIFAKDLDGDDNYGVAGTAGCIGGIADPEEAFAVGEDLADLAPDRAPKIAGHEVGHLLGAHHHYGNCAEGLLAGGDATEVCTLMAPMAPRFLSLRFATVTAAVVRGYAEEFATPLPPETAPPAGGGSADPSPSSGEPPPSQGQADRGDEPPRAPAIWAVTAGGSARRANAKRSFALRVRSSARVRDLVAELRCRRGRTAICARGKLASLDGRATVRMKVHRTLAARRYELRLTAMSASATRSIKTSWIRFLR